MNILLTSSCHAINRRCLSQTLVIAKQLPKTDPARDSAYRHPRKYVIRRNRPYRHRPDYQKTEREVLFDQVTQPHFPNSYVAPNYEYEIMSNLQSRWMERNVEMGDDRDTTKVYGPDTVEYQKCKKMFEIAKEGLLGIVIMAGDVNSTMEDHIYYDNKLNLKKTGANTFFFQNHIVYAYINNERPDLAFLKDVLYGCEEGEKDVIHFLYKEDTENLKKVIDAVKKHPYMELFGGIIEGECFSPDQIKKWSELKFEKEIGEILGLLDQAPRQLTSTLDQVPRQTVNLFNNLTSDLPMLLDQYVRDSSNGEE